MLEGHDGLSASGFLSITTSSLSRSATSIPYYPLEPQDLKLIRQPVTIVVQSVLPVLKVLFVDLFRCLEIFELQLTPTLKTSTSVIMHWGPVTPAVVRTATLRIRISGGLISLMIVVTRRTLPGLFHCFYFVVMFHVLTQGIEPCPRAYKTRTVKPFGPVSVVGIGIEPISNPLIRRSFTPSEIPTKLHCTTNLVAGGSLIPDCRGATTPQGKRASAHACAEGRGADPPGN
jgi:hypothetical protein